MTTPDGGESHVASPDAASEKMRIQAERGDTTTQLALRSAVAAQALTVANQLEDQSPQR